MRTVSNDSAVQGTVSRSKPWSDPSREDEPDPELTNGLMHFMNLQRNSIIGYIYDAEQGWRLINNPNNANKRKNRQLGRRIIPFFYRKKQEQKQNKKTRDKPVITRQSANMTVHMHPNSIFSLFQKAFGSRKLNKCAIDVKMCAHTYTELKYLLKTENETAFNSLGEFALNKSCDIV